MTWRKGHGNGAGQPRIEVLPPDEQPVGVPAPARQLAPRDASGRLLPGPGTTEQARRAGLASADARALGRLLGLCALPEGHAYGRYGQLGREFRDEHLEHLAANVGGGEVGPAVASLVSTAALQLAASRFHFDLGAATLDTKALLEASRLADASRQNLLAAHELAAREAKARPKKNADPLAAWREPKDGT